MPAQPKKEAEPLPKVATPLKKTRIPAKADANRHGWGPLAAALSHWRKRRESLELKVAEESSISSSSKKTVQERTKKPKSTN